MLRSGFIPALTVVLVAQTAIMPAYCQNSPGNQPNQKTTKPATTAASNIPKKPKSAAQIEQETYFQKFDKPMSLSDVPEISGHAKFRFGLERQDPKTHMTSIGQRFGTSSSPKEVIDYYKTSLTASHWKLKSVSTSNLQAVNGDRQLTINIVPKSSMDVKTDFFVNYTCPSRKL